MSQGSGQLLVFPWHGLVPQLVCRWPGLQPFFFWYSELNQGYVNTTELHP